MLIRRNPDGKVDMYDALTKMLAAIAASIIVALVVCAFVFAFGTTGVESYIKGGFVALVVVLVAFGIVITIENVRVNQAAKKRRSRLNGAP